MRVLKRERRNDSHPAIQADVSLCSFSFAENFLPQQAGIVPSKICLEGLKMALSIALNRRESAFKGSVPSVGQPILNAHKVFALISAFNHSSLIHLQILRSVLAL